jgi:hypothetical protein
VSGKRGWIRAFFLTIALTTIGCSARIIPPAHVADPVPVFVADYGRHSSILLPDKNGKLLEFAWGDYEWFAVNHNSAGDACAALFWSHGSTMGIRWLETAPQRPDLLTVVGCEHLLAFSASKQRAAALRDQLTERVIRHADTMVFNPWTDFAMVHDDEHYAMWHNCNHLTAEWLRQLDCRVKGFALLSHFSLEDAP